MHRMAGEGQVFFSYTWYASKLPTLLDCYQCHRDLIFAGLVYHTMQPPYYLFHPNFTIPRGGLFSSFFQTSTTTTSHPLFLPSHAFSLP